MEGRNKAAGRKEAVARNATVVANGTVPRHVVAGKNGSVTKNAATSTKGATVVNRAVAKNGAAARNGIAAMRGAAGMNAAAAIIDATAAYDNQCKRAIISFITSAETQRASYSSQKLVLMKALQRHRWFDEGDLMDTMEKGVIYPIIHFFDVTDNGQRPPMSLQDPAALGEEFTLKQGLYLEIKHATPAVISKPSTQTGDLVRRTASIFLAFKKLDNQFCETLEDTWKDWTGSRSIYLTLSDEFEMSRLSFYRRMAPRDPDMFMYIVIIQCDNVTSANEIRLLDYVQRQRVERMMGYLSVYNVERLIPSTANVINGLLKDVVDSTDKVSI